MALKSLLASALQYMLLGMVEDVHFSATVGNCSGEQGEEASLCCPPSKLLSG